MPQYFLTVRIPVKVLVKASLKYRQGDQLPNYDSETFVFHETGSLESAKSLLQLFQKRHYAHSFTWPNIFAMVKATELELEQRIRYREHIASLDNKEATEEHKEHVKNPNWFKGLSGEDAGRRLRMLNNTLRRFRRQAQKYESYIHTEDLIEGGPPKKGKRSNKSGRPALQESNPSLYKTYKTWAKEWATGKYKNYSECASIFGGNTTKDDIRRAVNFVRKTPKKK